METIYVTKVSTIIFLLTEHIMGVRQWLLLHNERHDTTRSQDGKVQTQ